MRCLGHFLARLSWCPLLSASWAPIHAICACNNAAPPAPTKIKIICPSHTIILWTLFDDAMVYSKGKLNRNPGLFYKADKNPKYQRMTSGGARGAQALPFFRATNKSAFSTNTQPRFATVLLDSVLGPPRLAHHTWSCPCISEVPKQLTRRG